MAAALPPPMGNDLLGGWGDDDCSVSGPEIGSAQPTICKAPVNTTQPMWSWALPVPQPIEDDACSGFSGVSQTDELTRYSESAAPTVASPNLVASPGPDTGLIVAQSLDDQGKLVVVLDLDETLVRYRDGPVYWRPHFGAFLDSIKACCEVVLWTASTEESASSIINELDPDGDRFHHKVFRDDRWFNGVPYCKDLMLLQRDMNRIIIVENTVDCVIPNPENALLVPDYIYPCRNDTALLVTQEIILGIARGDPGKSVQVQLRRHKSIDHVLHPLGNVMYVSQKAQAETPAAAPPQASNSKQPAAPAAPPNTDAAGSPQLGGDSSNSASSSSSGCHTWIGGWDDDDVVQFW
eukprot:TRINITY_DN4401_c0_g1_i1.p1 TRINITY_DN4401_c0_g1~~TRINITY_DN4401_c0_g1_i1.p1  ORF type:complete len:385 (+),score=115.62 TRINITY_DN4401_c0_g1_i1:104-1156(+)